MSISASYCFWNKASCESNVVVTLCHASPAVQCVEPLLLKRWSDFTLCPFSPCCFPPLTVFQSSSACPFIFLSVTLLTSLSEVTYVFVLSWHSTSFFFHVLWFCFHIIQLQTFSLILWYTTSSPSSPIFLSVPLDLQLVRAAMKKGLPSPSWELSSGWGFCPWSPPELHHSGITAMSIPGHGPGWFRPGPWPTG